MIAVLVLLMVGLVSGSVVCPGGTKCQDKTTCCQTETGYACCQYPSIPAEEEEERAPAPLVKSDNSSASVVHCDNIYICSDGTTCCRSPFGQWSCCPYSLGQCCRDGLHCCPFGYRCDSTSTVCFRGTLSLPASPQTAAMQSNTIQVPAEEEEKRAPAPLVKSDNPSASVVRCNSIYSCPDGTTCCRSPFGQWSCCVFRVGQCCRDGLHCCPLGFRCDSTSTRCFRGTLSVPATPQIAAMQSNTIQVPAEEEEKRAPAPLVKSDNPSASVVRCNSIYTCPDGTTCCRSPFGQWSCCVFRVGQCCRDGLHCCPLGFRCDSTSTRCFRGTLSVPATPQIAAMQSNTIQVPAEEEEKRAPAPLVKSDNPSASVVRCNSIYSCPDGTTCCRSPFGQWSCCVFRVGQCCRDGLHCCPLGFRCDSTSTRCFRGTLSVPATPQIAAMQSNTIQVPAEEEEERAPAPLVKSDNPSASVVRCNSIYTCPDGTTCCRSPFGQWSCCVFRVGQCCRDGLHCCPLGFRCDSTSTRCFRGTLSLPASPQIAAMQSNTIQVPAEEEEKRAPAPLVKSDNPSASVVRCNSIYTCPDGTTCCRSPFGQWSCCVFRVGQCCRDGLHCCPLGFRCDSTSTRCFRGTLSLPATPQIAAMQSNTIQVPAEEEEERAPAPLVKSDNPSASVVRCNSIYTCPDGTTCCRSPFGQWSCCVFRVGQCCRDGLHCCPLGFRCDSTSTRCFRGTLSVPATPQIAAMQSNTIQSVPPQIPAEEEEERAPAPLVKSDNSSASVVHCDNIYICPDGTTCCRSPFGQWSCCPYSLGQCCRDGLHCCPFGYRCDFTSTRCFRGTLSLPASPQIAAMQSNTIQVPAEEEEKRAPAPLVKSDNPSASVVRCNSIYSCPDGTTCCRSPSGRWSCCVFRVGQCCRDGLHCCPLGFRCDSTSTRCFRGTLSVPATPQIAAMQSNTIQVPAEEEEERAPAPLVKSDNSSASVVHCDNIYICPDGTTCCRSPFGQWSCCPYSLGQCCRDGLHCCPFGYRCDFTSTRCFRGTLSVPATPQIAAMQSNTIQVPAEEEEERAPAPLVKSDNPSASVVRCNSIYTCPDGTTCCRSPFGQWSCCVFRVGQCCRDGLHCCPLGFRCDSTSTRCFRGTLSLPASPQIAAMQSNTIQDQCCQGETGCCPVGFHCDEESKACVEDFDHSSPLKSALNPQNQAGIIHCSNRFYCPAGNSCCKTLTGQWACCPYPLGQCCKDGKHCCEYGYDCNTTFTKCKRGYSSIPALLTKEALLL
ncbi:uncharacterized protein LOC113536235 isoform X3 [Pangasianodon hypophthalmus]|uniref:uncharacterized protein LOC113536235 isoform X3 n=1 Tax=Pangasianodon hypophthalmus TaxID=310915 RepID=UPI00230722DE|nr:uncharacterized protein LOC113536235 isoform X3 [Pangasianodon hypophthalmus]